MLISGDDEGIAIIWDLKTLKPIFTINTEQQLKDNCFQLIKSENEQILITRSENEVKTYLLFNLKTTISNLGFKTHLISCPNF